jgi:hypothetical protein
MTEQDFATMIERIVSAAGASKTFTSSGEKLAWELGYLTALFAKYAYNDSLIGNDLYKIYEKNTGRTRN